MSVDGQKVYIATRQSELAVTQSEMVARSIESAASGVTTELVKMKTSGDIKSESSSGEIGDKKDWIAELEKAIVEKRVDFAVHSGKDVPADIDDATCLIPVLTRESPLDAFIGIRADGSEQSSLLTLKTGAVIGTSSLRRKAQILHLRSDYKVIEHRGNIQTRIDKLRKSEKIDGILLAVSGLTRLGLEAEIGEHLRPDVMMPAVNQGILVAQCRKDNLFIMKVLSSIVDVDTRIAWEAERGCVDVLGADCKSAVGVIAYILDSSVEVSCRVLSHDGQICIEESKKGQGDSAYEVGRQVGMSILDRGGAELLLGTSNCSNLDFSPV